MNALRLLIWSVFPTHHQSAFFDAIRAHGIDLRVHYYERVSPRRLALGWSDYARLPPQEHYVAPSLRSLARCGDWRERIHLIPGYSRPFLPALALRLSLAAVPWLHWSEPSQRTSRSWRTEPVRRAYGWLVQHHAAGALAIGELARRDFMRWGIDPSRIRFLPYAVAPPGPAMATAAPAAPGRDGVRLLFLGSLEHRKGLDVLLEALQGLSSRHGGLRLEVAGTGPLEEHYRQMSAALGLDDRVRFIGAVPAAEVAATLSRCDVLVLPTRFDGWGVVLNEAAAMGKALISTESCGAAHHLIRPDINGYRVPPDRPDLLAGAIGCYCDDPGLAALHGERSLELFSEFTPRKNVERLLAALASLRCPAASA